MMATVLVKVAVHITRDYQEAIGESVAVLGEKSVRLTVGDSKLYPASFTFSIWTTSQCTATVGIGVDDRGGISEVTCI